MDRATAVVFHLLLAGDLLALHHSLVGLPEQLRQPIGVRVGRAAVSEAVGFNDYFYFMKKFKKETKEKDKLKNFEICIKTSVIKGLKTDIKLKQNIYNHKT